MNDGQGTDLTAAPLHLAAPATPRRRTPLWALLSVAGNVVSAVAIVAGFFHIVTGGDGGCHVIEKDGWALEDTFVDLDDYVGKSLFELLPKAKVVRALRGAELITLPADRGE